MLLKTICLLLVTFLPLCVYIYTREHSQYIFNINSSGQINKYIIRAEFNPVDKEIYLNQEIIFTNNIKRQLKKIYFYLYPNSFQYRDYHTFHQSQMSEIYPNGFNPGYIDINSVKVDEGNCDYKIIGKDKTILMVSLNKPIDINEKIIIDVEGNVKIPNRKGRFGFIEDTYSVTNWHPTLAMYNQKGWHLDFSTKVEKSFYSDVSNYHVELITPKDYIPKVTGSIVKKVKLEDKVCYHIDGFNLKDFPIVISKSLKNNGRE